MASLKHTTLIACGLGITFTAVVYTFSGCTPPEPPASSGLPVVPLSERVALDYDALNNEEATIPPQCYTKTESVHNPCYVCHQNYDRSVTEYRQNKMDDGSLQGLYQFSDIGTSNHWSNLFVDRTEWVAQISDEAILNYINRENYTSLAPRLQNAGWQGFIPDLENYHLGAAAFDDQGFAKDGSGWVAFNYKPLPSTFWPTNGATDDVLIRLPEAFRQLNGSDNRSVYQANLALVEMTIKRLDRIEIAPFNEAELQIDINRDGVLDQQVTEALTAEYYVGDAANIAVVAQQYPEQTQFMHSVRYVGVDDNGETTVPARMKELRYMKKTRVLSNDELESRYSRERKEKLDEELPAFVRLGDEGFSNGFGWLVQGFIEDYNGELRAQTYEEDFFCMGCHAAVGTTIDQTFAFGRKIDGAAGWGYIDLKGMPDAPSKGQTEGEILQYLKLSGGGHEFRENAEMLARWYNPDGSVNEAAVNAADVFELITPSRERALQLNKAYTHIVRHQSFLLGRDATTSPVNNVFQEVDESVPPLAAEHRFLGWELRLDW